MSETIEAPAAAPSAAAPSSAAPTPAPAATAAPTAAAPAQASPPVAFADTLPEDIRGEAAFRDIRSLDALAKGYLGAQKLLGHKPENLLVMPGAEDTAAMEAIYTRLGRPEKPDGYTLTPLPEGQKADERLIGDFLQSAHKAGLSSRQADVVFQAYNAHVAARVAEAQAEAQARNDATVTALKQEFGVAYEQKGLLAKKALEQYADADLVAFLTTPGPDGRAPGDDPRWIRAFAKMGEQLAEDGVIGRPESGALMKSPAEAQQEINHLRTDPMFQASYMDKKSPGHADAVKKMQALYEQAHPNFG